MKEEGGFLARWSRLKRGSGTDPLPNAPGPAQPPSLPEGQSLEDLVAALPRIEDLVPGQSLGAFMQPWVPAALRNAALQRMWLLDPAISGYVDPALDYAHDYNTLGAVPGFGPMETSPEAVREVHEMFDRALGAGAETSSEPGGGDGENASDDGKDASSLPGAPLSGREDRERGHSKARAMAPSPPMAVRRAGEPAESAAAGKPAQMPGQPRFKRHGGALPM